MIESNAEDCAAAPTVVTAGVLALVETAEACAGVATIRAAPAARVVSTVRWIRLVTLECTFVPSPSMTVLCGLARPPFRACRHPSTYFGMNPPLPKSANVWCAEAHESPAISDGIR